ncbi:MAG: hypothetical protein ABSH44_05985 [Bryobacteraceae bacterium]|jgi:hypothetical protein
MKTTVDLPDDLLNAAKKLAAENRTTLRSLVERGLRRELGGSESRAARRIAALRQIRRWGRALRTLLARIADAGVHPRLRDDPAATGCSSLLAGFFASGLQARKMMALSICKPIKSVL